ncbi:DUF3427 domain-containing protein [Peribacillus butanolivorans]|uniref:DUF3427 domain-containing protein n=1 Tax=Peribacillus butanolivorans TaxID=421767 RepID=UPI00207CAF1D|nr:DUF3427 domain-containing protein [Peribacillus butanolivorans]MCO0600951.1 DUF3427 domain-containing protein [Peribacillus butanolivorans]
MKYKPFKVGDLYSRKDVYKIINVPKEKQGGIWDTGYTRYNNDWFIFANVNTSGRTGHDYQNKFIGNDLEWYGKNRTKITQGSIQGMLNPNGNVFIFAREDNNNPLFTYIGNGRVKETFDTIPVKIIWQFTDHQENHPEIIPEEIVSEDSLFEGGTKTIKVNIYERSPMARKRCIDHYGLNCSVCSFNFYDKYGEIGKDFIHVHHLVPLHEIKDVYEIDPIRDLRPVCPNCHAMLHKRKPALSIEELKEVIIVKN